MRTNRKTAVLLASMLVLPAAAFAADGKAAFEGKCTMCHAASRSLSAKKDKAGWEKTIDRMRGKGADVDAAEAAAIADYLAGAAGK